MSKNMETRCRLILYIPATEWCEHAGVAPTHIVHMASFVKKSISCDVTIIDAAMQYGIPLTEKGAELIVKASLKDISNLVDRWNCVFGVSATSAQDVVAAIPIMSQVKKQFGIPVIMGGYGAAIPWKMLLNRYSTIIDAIVIGAGERPLVQLISQINNRKFDFSGIPGVAWYSRKEPVFEVQRPTITPTTVPDWSLLPNKDSYHCAATFSSIGCRMGCRFCVEPAMLRTPSQVPLSSYIEAIDSIASELPNVKALWLTDPLIGGSQSHASEILKVLTQRNYKLFFNARCDCFNDDWLIDVSPGQWCIYFGFESANDRALHLMNKTHVPSEYRKSMEFAYSKCLEKEVLPIIGVIANFPGVTFEEARETIWFLNSIVSNHPEQGSLGRIISGSQFMIHNGDISYESLRKWEASGYKFVPALPTTYLGHQVPTELELIASKTAYDYDSTMAIAIIEQLQRLSRITKDTQNLLSSFGYTDPNMRRKYLNGDIVSVDTLKKLPKT